MSAEMNQSPEKGGETPGASIDELKAPGSTFELSLTRMLGVPVQDVLGYVSHDFGEDTPVFKITRIQLADGKFIRVEGEHDTPYIPADPADLPNLSSERMNEIYEHLEG